MTADTSAATANAAVMKRAIDAFGTGDMATLAEVFSPDLKWHVPGRSPAAGDYNGRDAVFGFFGKLMELSSGTFRVEALDIIGDEKGGVFIMNDTGERNGKKLNSMMTVRVHIKDGQFVEVWDHAFDLYAYDEFWSAT